MMGCNLLGGMLHFTLLSAFCWMAVEGHILYYMFVVVFALSGREADARRMNWCVHFQLIDNFFLLVQERM
jgi:hypothetical protein